MFFDTLELLNYRNYPKLKITFSPSKNIIYGKNGSGKTNIVEALYVLGLTKSFRNTSERNLIYKEKNNTKIKAKVVKNKKKTKYEVDLYKDGKKVMINNNIIGLLSNYISNIPIIVFFPDDLKLIKETPIIRRKFLNVELSFNDRLYLINVTKYNKLLKQRNSYLKQLQINGNQSKEYLDILTKKMIDYGKYIYSSREEFINYLNDNINDYYQKIVKKGHLKIKYVSNFNLDEEKLIKKINDLYQKELLFGKTLIGTHLDDIEFYLDDNKVKDWASEGQLKNIVISIKLVEVKYIYEKLGYYPILILDDLFSELDKEKINNIINLLPNECQIFITTTEISKIKKSLRDNSKIIKVNNGVVEE